MFSLFRQRRLRGFDYAPRYYDAAKEAREERRKRATGGSADPDAFRERLRHSWQREGSDRASVLRLAVIMGLVCAILFFIIKAFGLLQHFAWPT